MWSVEYVRFDWDRANIDHLAVHRVSPQEAEAVFLGDPVDLDYQFEDEEIGRAHV